MTVYAADYDNIFADLHYHRTMAIYYRYRIFKGCCIQLFNKLYGAMCAFADENLS